jgi:hypothetical protein
MAPFPKTQIIQGVQQKPLFNFFSLSFVAIIHALQVIAIVAVTKTKNALLNSGTVGLGETGLLETSDIT